MPTAHARFLLLCPVLASAVLLVGVAVPAHAQNQAIVSLAWNGVSAGPRAQDYPTAMDDHDIFVLEDFQTSAPWLVGRFSCVGAAPNGGVSGLAALILDGLPPAGQVVMQSPAGGGYVNAFPWGHYETNFGGQRLEPGSYWIMWAAQGDPGVLLPVMFVRDGAYTIGQGLPNNALQYNPGLWWNLPGGRAGPGDRRLQQRRPAHRCQLHPRGLARARLPRGLQSRQCCKLAGPL